MAKRRMRWILASNRYPQTLNELNLKFISCVLEILIGQIQLCIKVFELDTITHQMCT